MNEKQNIEIIRAIGTIKILCLKMKSCKDCPFVYGECCYLQKITPANWEVEKGDDEIWRVLYG